MIGSLKTDDLLKNVGRFQKISGWYGNISVLRIYDVKWKKRVLNLLRPYGREINTKEFPNSITSLENGESFESLEKPVESGLAVAYRL